MKQLERTIELRISWADLDLFGHVNNVAFFRYIQDARLAYCEELGLTSLNEAGKLSFMVASSCCRFKSPLHYPGMVTVLTRADWVKNTSIQLSYVLESNGTVVAEGEDVLVIYDHHLKCKSPVPAEMREKLSLPAKHTGNSDNS
jgi:acyl-CoA thioester hydrolase